MSLLYVRKSCKMFVAPDAVGLLASVAMAENLKRLEAKSVFWWF